MILSLITDPLHLIISLTVQFRIYCFNLNPLQIHTNSLQSPFIKQHSNYKLNNLENQGRWTPSVLTRARKYSTT
ncbi:hypothetical protein FGO68_gene15400 [Halteria grandinella]|uniref:Uncharacterized protein n=1 Tax=Halteria grandinella TaxID=5974 RepID=A0A8J8NW61_HALGN|nr:hypothetical protein FGO68_gene15400 [Halteria grandinella]